jgi:hypothetical protein
MSAPLTVGSYVVGTPPVSAGEPLCGLGHLAETSGVA